MLSLNYKNIPHAIATFLKATVAEAKKALPVVEKALDTVEGDKTAVEGASGAIANAIAPGTGAAVVSIEDALFSIGAAVDAALKAGGDAAVQKFLDAGLDVTAINNAKAIGTQTSAFYSLLQSVKA